MNHPTTTCRSRFGVAFRVVAWATLLAACGAILVSRSARARDRNREHLAALKAHYQAVRLYNQQMQERLDREQARTDEIMGMLFDADRPSLQTPQDLQTRLNDGRPFHVLSQQADSVDFGWIDPVHGNEWTLKFKKGRFAGTFHNWSGPQLLPPPLPAPPQGDAFESYRRTLVGFYPWQGLAPPAWLLLVTTWAFAGPFRRAVSEIVLATAVICTTFWLAHPGFVSFTSWNSIFSNDSLLWATLMLLVSVACLIASYRRGRAGTVPATLADWRVLRSEST